MANLVIPGVSVQVIRELVPAPMASPGVLGIIGCTAGGADDCKLPLQIFGSLQEVQSYYGAPTLASIPELRQAFASGLQSVVVSPVNWTKDSPTIASAVIVLTADDGSINLKVKAKVSGAWANQLYVSATTKVGTDGKGKAVDVTVYYTDPKTPVESFRNLSSSTANLDAFFANIVSKNSNYVTLEIDSGLMQGKATVSPSELLQRDKDPVLYPLAGGKDPSAQDCQDALDRLKDIEEVDMVAASLSPDDGNLDVISQVYSNILAHCEQMAANNFPRIGFGQTVVQTDDIHDVNKAKATVSTLISERFVFVAPAGYQGAVIGMIAGMDYFQSPTFKQVPGVSKLPWEYKADELDGLILNGIFAIDKIPHKGIVCVKGITTDGGPINVTRVADVCVRQIYQIASMFIGLLNTDTQRLALKQLIIQAFTAMENQQALVKSADGKLPAFVVDVSSTPADFAQGIVRIAAAVRPVRSIDYIYATLTVQAF